MTDIDGVDWTRPVIEERMKILAAKNDMKLGQIMGPLRAAITGSHQSPSMFEAMEILGKAETLKRLRAA